GRDAGKGKRQASSFLGARFDEPLRTSRPCVHPKLKASVSITERRELIIRNDHLGRFGLWSVALINTRMNSGIQNMKFTSLTALTLALSCFAGTPGWTAELPEMQQSAIIGTVERDREQLGATALAIWGFAEVGYQETQSSAR